jgi:hypothetical protein
MKTERLKKEPLDLHGVKHIDVVHLVVSYIIRNRNFLPLQIITGNSDKMKDLVIKSIKENNFKYHIGDQFNKGYIIIK